MKKLIIFLLAFVPLFVAAQTPSKGYLRYDSVEILKTGGFSNLLLRDRTMDSTGGVYYNAGKGLLRAKRTYALNDSSFIIGGDTVRLRLGTGGGGGGLSGLTSTRVVVSTSSTTVGDFSGFTYNSATPALTVPRVMLGTTSATLAPLNFGAFSATVPSSPAAGMQVYRLTDSAILLRTNANDAWLPIKYTRDVVVADNLSLSYGPGLGPDTLRATGGSVSAYENNAHVVSLGGTPTINATPGFPKSTLIASTVNNKRIDQTATILCEDGSYLKVYTLFGNNSGDADTARLYGTRSTDGCYTWGTPFLIVNDVGPGDYIPSMYLQADGDIVLLYLHALTTTTNEMRRRISTDNGATWGSSSTIYGSGASKYFSPKSDVITVTDNGDWLYPLPENTNGTLTSGTGNYINRILQSTNEGSTWALLSTAVQYADSLAVESQIVKDSSGYLYLFSRNRNQTMTLNISTNHGATWDAAVLSGIESSNSTSSFLYHEPSNALLIVHNRYSSLGGFVPRVYLDVSISYDMGKTVKRVYNIDVESGYHFIEPTPFLVGNEVLVDYSRGDGTGTYYDLKNARIPLYSLVSGGGGNANTFNNIDIIHTQDGVNNKMFRMYQRGYSTPFFTIRPQTWGNAYMSGMFESSSNSQPFLWYNEVPVSTPGIVIRNTTPGPAAFLDGLVLLDINNYNTNRFRLYSQGDLVLTGTGATTLQNGTVGQRPGSPVAGMTRYVSDGTYLNKLEVYNGSAWKSVAWTTDTTGLGGGGGGGSYTFTNGTQESGGTVAGGGTLTAALNYTQAGFRIRMNEGLDVGIANADAGNMIQVGSTTAMARMTFLQTQNDANYYNEFRVIKNAGAGNFALASGDPIFSINAQTSVALFQIRAGHDLGSDNIRNPELMFLSRNNNGATGQRWQVRSDGAMVGVKHQSTGTLNADFIKWYSGDLAEANAFFRFYNYATGGTGGQSLGFETRSHSSGRGYGMNLKFNTTAADEGVRFNINNDAAAITGTNEAYNFLTHTTSLLRILGNGNATFTGNITVPLVKITSGAPGSGKVLTSDADGDATWETPTGGVAWGGITGTLTDQTDLGTALGLKSNIASPTFTGTPAAPTAAVGTNTTQIATTAFVMAANTFPRLNVVGADPTNWSAAANSMTILPDLTGLAGATVTLPSAATYVGTFIIIRNLSSDATFKWTFASTVHDNAGSTVTNITDLTTYQLISDGTQWVIIN